MVRRIAPEVHPPEYGHYPFTVSVGVYVGEAPHPRVPVVVRRYTNYGYRSRSSALRRAARERAKNPGNTVDVWNQRRGELIA